MLTINIEIQFTQFSYHNNDPLPGVASKFWLGVGIGQLSIQRKFCPPPLSLASRRDRRSPMSLILKSFPLAAPAICGFIYFKTSFFLYHSALLNKDNNLRRTLCLIIVQLLIYHFSSRTFMVCILIKCTCSKKNNYFPWVEAAVPCNVYSFAPLLDVGYQILSDIVVNSLNKTIRLYDRI